MHDKIKQTDPAYPLLSKDDYRPALREAQIDLVNLQRRLIERNERVLVIIEGRDAAGKDGLIKRLTQHMAPRETRVFAIGKPSVREDSEWYFQRFIAQLPAGGEFVVFNRSWYNRAGVEHIMGFCSNKDYEQFMVAVVDFEALLVRDGMAVLKYYLDISKPVQKERLAERLEDPLTQWKVSPIDQAAQKHWADYSAARDEMFKRTSHEAAPWLVVRADDKKTARVALIRDLLYRLDHGGKAAKANRPDRRIVFPYSEEAARDGMIAP